VVVGSDTWDKPGVTLEDAVFAALQRQLELGEIPFAKESTIIHKGRSYWSADRGKNIKFDVSVEISMKGLAQPYILWILECKDYSHAVPVDDVEEFHAKLEQIGADKTKGTIVVRGTLQSGAIKYARSKGIGLARILPGDKLRYVFSAPNLGDSNSVVLRALTDADFVSVHGRCLGFLAPDGRAFFGLPETFLAEEARRILQSRGGSTSS
jgi:hypothetical protein